MVLKRSGACIVRFVHHPAPWVRSRRDVPLRRQGLQVFNAEEPVPLVNGSLLVQCDYPELGKKELQVSRHFFSPGPSLRSAAGMFPEKKNPAGWDTHPMVCVNAN